MGLLVFFLFLFSTQVFASLPSLVTGVVGTVNGSAGTGETYTAGTTFQMNLGSDDDLSNRSGDLHVSYTNEIAPLNPADLQSPIKHSNDWAGGFSANLSKTLFLGADLDSTIDPSESLETDGIKGTLGIDPYRFSFKYARNTIRSPFTVITRTFDGAFVYQGTLEAQATYDIGKIDSFIPDIQYSFFTPNAAAFGTLLSVNALASISSFQDTLQSFEQWSVGLTWKRNWTDKWDTSLMARIAHLIIPASPMIEGELDVGRNLGDLFHLQIGLDYNHDPAYHQALVNFELKFNWQQGS